MKSRSMVVFLVVLTATWMIFGCGSKEVEVDDSSAQMTPEQQAMVEQMKQMQEERDRTMLPLPGPSPVQAPAGQ